jgi:hypothetical protein
VGEDIIIYTYTVGALRFACNTPTGLLVVHGSLGVPSVRRLLEREATISLHGVKPTIGFAASLLAVWCHVLLLARTGLMMGRLILIAWALLLAGAADVDWSKAEPVSVVMVDDKFVPERLTLRHGVPYRLHLENRGKDLHEFTAPEFFADAIVRDPSVLANAQARRSWCSRGEWLMCFWYWRGLVRFG